MPSIETGPKLRDILATTDAAGVKTWLKAVPEPAERRHQLAKLSTAELRNLGEVLDRKTAKALLDSVDDELAARAMTAMEPAVAAPLIASLDTDHGADILRQMTNSVRESVLNEMTPTRAAALRRVLEWPKESVAAHMTPEALAIPSTLTVAAAVELLRSNADDFADDLETSAYIYATAADGRLVGVVAFRDLVLANANRVISELMNDDLLWMSPLTDAEDAAQALEDHHLVAVPVVDGDMRLLGILTQSTAAEIAEEEATEDAERQGGSVPLEVPYLRASPWHLWRKRIGWLLLLFIAEAYTGTVLRHFEEEMEAVVALAFFIPLLIGTGGNTGTQITTTLVRALATGDVRFRDVPSIIAKEISTGMLIALTMGFAAVVRAWTLGVGPEVTLCVALTIAAIVLWSSFIASILPPLLKKCRLDPALVSAPAIATIVDGTGLIIYFLIAHATLSQLQGL
ncbi:magnesium transporter [Mycobacterium sp. 236(2023)]|uniref:magnesium transporter n=1 Tax=Mycobacterium sp. 236(2023) TaxID=3038163 RepID=UPI0024150342|nr:magnesium transporter [Mycobacterium sp. 236(2023)]MDG4667365.1 magnesium transporter [Mycobacterium sp. 236(2023)]